MKHRLVPSTVPLMLLIALLASCGPAAPGPTAAPASATTPLGGSGDAERTLLTCDVLLNGPAPTSPVDDGALALPAGAAPPAHTFEGRLELHGEDSGGGFQQLRGATELPAEAHHLPEFDFEFVQSGSYLIPARRGLVVTSHPDWNYFLEPGRVWQEEGDQGYSRATFPFALSWKGSSATFNGVMGFLFNDQDVSQVWYQITQETSSSHSADLWGLLRATYHRGPVAEAGRTRDAFARELAQRFPSRPIEQLAVDYPGVDVAAFGRGITPQHMTAYGLVVNGVNYVGGCRTRYGTYAYCESMRMPSYSTAKSIFAAGVMMRLAQKYGPEIPSLLIVDYVPEAAAAAGDWNHVTFDHALDMATGNYRSSGFMADEDSTQEGDFWSTEYYQDRIAAAFRWPHKADSGTRWVYHTSDTFIVVRAMQNYLQSREGPDADIWQFFVDEVLVPLQVGPGAYSSLRTRDDNWQGQAYGGYGLWWTHDDVAKIATFLNNDGGAVDGVQLLQPDLLAAALQRDPDDRGVDMGSGGKYNDGFWAVQLGPAEGFACRFWVPHMVGYSGIVIALLPNGTSYYYFSDNREFTWLDAVQEADKIVPLCP